MKRRLLKLGLLLLAGAIVNVAVAWGLIISDRSNIGVADVCTGVLSPTTTMKEHNWNFIMYERPGRTTVWWRQQLRSLFHHSAPPLHEHGPVVSWPLTDPSWPPAPRAGWSEPPPIPRDSKDKFHQWTYFELGAGWPRVALTCRGSIQLEENVHGGIRLGALTLVTSLFDQYILFPIQMPRVLPCRPHWPGFAINTIFYAAMLWVVFFVPGMVRRRIRRRRGLCPACAYPIGTSPVCTECGNPLKVRTGMGLPPPATPATEKERRT